MELAIIPRFLVRFIISDSAKQIHANILISNLLVIAILLVLTSHRDFILAIPHFCVFEEIFKTDGPGCGVTRSVFAIADGNYMQAWNSNPAGLFVFIYFVAQIPLRIIAIMFVPIQKQVSQLSRLGSNIIICILLFVWIVKLTH